MFTIDEKADMYKMRQSGSTLQEIADKYNVTREYVRNVLDCTKKKIPKKNIRSCIFPEIKNWMIENEVSVAKLSAMTDIGSYALTAKLNGVRLFKKNEIDKICKVTGMTYEKAFREE